MRRNVILFFILLCVVGASIAFVLWPALKRNYATVAVNNMTELRDLQQTREYLNNGQPEEAWGLIQRNSQGIHFETDMGREWLELLIRASEATLNYPQLILLYEYHPRAFDSHEKAALLIGNQYLLKSQGREYQQLRDSWKGRESSPEKWFVLDADQLLLQGRRKEAIELLNSKNFPGKSDSARLIRLALLYVSDQPKVAWEYLTLAYSKDPENPDIRSYRAKLLETVGKLPLALSEYQAAAQIEPKNLYLQDQLAEFYARTKHYPEALKIWQDHLKPPSVDFIWLKALFWGRVATPFAFPWHTVQTPQGNLEPLIDYLLALRPGAFWDSVAFERIPDGQTFLTMQQATFWLRVLEDLKLGKEKEAYDLLQYNPFSGVSWNSKLEQELKRILLYRRTGKFIATPQNPLDNSQQVEQLPNTKDESPFFAKLDQIASLNIAVPSDLNALLNGPEAFAAAFFAAGWAEAGLQFHELQVIPATYPDWYTFEVIEAMRQNRGVETALEFAQEQTPSPEASLLIGELLISKGNPEAALDYLARLRNEDSDIGFKAAWLMSLIYMEEGRYREAKMIIADQPRLEQDVLGRETLARIALLEGDASSAEALYSSLESVSPEAQSYLARKAFEERDWKRARELTEKLLRLYPSNTLLRENLRKIAEEQSKRA